jgi:anti-sigma factor RsiW
MQGAIRAGVTRHRAPLGLALRIGNMLPHEAIAPAPTVRTRWRMAPLAGTGFAGSLAGVALTLLVIGEMVQHTDRAATEAVLDSHIRSLMPDHLTDVLTADQHTVKPWLSAHLDVSPPVSDFVAEGFPLVGGREDYIDGHPAAAVVYRHAMHVINLFAWAASDAADAPFRIETRQGFNLISWRHGGIEYVAVSDVETDQLAAFTRLVAGAG